jgi:DivIVA domain-containing protein
MSTNDLDLPLLPSAEQIRRKEFASVRRGYDTEQVREFLRLVAEQVETLERELQDVPAVPAEQEQEQEQAPEAGPSAEAVPDVSGELALPALQPAKPAPQDEAPDRMSQRIAHVLEAAEEEAAAAIADARAEAAGRLAAARAEADRIRVDAQARAEEDRQRGRETLARAKRESAAELMGLERRREELSGRLREMRSMLIAAADELQVEAEPSDGAASGAAGDVELDERIEQIFGPRDRVDLPDLEPSPPEPDAGT